MRVLLSLLLLCSYSFAGITATVEGSTTPASIVKTMMGVQTTVPSYRSILPGKDLIDVVVTGDPAWTVAVSAGLVSPCSGTAGFCLAVTGPFNGTLVSGTQTGNQTVASNWNHNGGGSLSPQTLTGTITFTQTVGGATAVINVTLNIISSSAANFLVGDMKFTSILSPSGTTQVQPTNAYTHPNIFTIPNYAPFNALPAVQQPAVGASYVDPTFGGTVKRITNTNVGSQNCQVQYAGKYAISTLDTYVITLCGVYKLSDASLVRAYTSFPSGWGIGAIDPDPTNDQSFYLNVAGVLSKYNFVTNTQTSLGDYTGAPWNMTGMDEGGTQGLSSDGWGVWAVNNAGVPRLLVVDLKQLEIDGAPSTNNSYIGTWSNAQAPGCASISTIDWVQVSDIDIPTGQRYAWMSSTCASFSWTVGAKGSGVLNEFVVAPEYPQFQVNNGDNLHQGGEHAFFDDEPTHGRIGRDADGQVYYFFWFSNIIENVNTYAMMRLSAGHLMARPVSEGGGLTIMQAQTNFDSATGYSPSIHGFLISTSPDLSNWYSDLSGNPTYSTGVVTIPTVQTPDWSVSATTPVLIANATGSWTCMNGAWTGTHSSGNNVTIPAPGCSAASGSAGSFALIGDTLQQVPSYRSNPSGFNQQLIVMRRGRQVHVPAFHRDVSWFNISDTPLLQYYNGQPKCSPSMSGKYIACNSNFGSLDYNCVNCNTSVYVISTGLGTDVISGSTLQPAETSALLSWSISTGAACTVEVASDSGFQTIVNTIVSPAGPISRQLSLGTLTANTLYWWRNQCGMDVDASVTPFLTLPAGTPATQTVVTSVPAPVAPLTTATKVVLEHRKDGAGGWTAVSSVACAYGGSGCSVNWAGDTGYVNNFRFNYQDAGSVTLYTTPSYSINVSR